MKTITPESLSNKLKNAPQSVSGKVAGYIDALLDEEVLLFHLTEKQKKILDCQEKLSPSDYIEANEVVSTLEKKYELLGYHLTHCFSKCR